MKKKIIVTGIILFCLVSLIVFLCVKNINKSNEQSSNSNNFKIVTSFYPMYIIAENLTKNAQNIELSNMAEVNGGCLHDYTLSTNDVKKFENADVFIENGVGIENFTEKLLQVYSNLKVIDSSTGITDIINDEEGENQNKKSGRASASPMLCDKPCIRSCTLRSSCGYRIAHFLVSRLYKSGILLEAGRHFQGGLESILQIYYCINRRMIRKRRFLLSQAVDRGR